jgi:hypothetical protein
LNLLWQELANALVETGKDPGHFREASFTRQISTGQDLATEATLVISLHCLLGILADVFNSNCGLFPGVCRANPEIHRNIHYGGR